MKYTHLTNMEQVMDPTQPLYTIDSFVSGRQRELEQEAEQDELERATRKVVSIRLDVQDIHLLEELAKRLQLNRTRLATELLEAAIEQTRASLSVPRRGIMRVDSTPTEAVLKNADGVVIGTYRDDAIQIGGGDQ